MKERIELASSGSLHLVDDPRGDVSRVVVSRTNEKNEVITADLKKYIYIHKTRIRN